jgi:ribosomal protein S18 acetylase RimI-like enzyme
MNGLEIRDARASDYASYVRLFAELGIDDAPVSEAKFAQEMVPNSAFAERGGDVVGFTFWRSLATSTHLSHIVSAPEARRTGAGRALLLDAVERARRRGSASMTLHVATGNLAAKTLYESAGFRVVSQSRALRLAWSALAKTTLTAEARSLEAADDSDVEERFALPAGTFAAHRGKPDRVLHYLETDEGAAAAVFDVAFPGCNPFRATDAEHALALLRALQTHARREHSFINLALEDQLALADALVATGATLRFEMLKMRLEL